MYYTLNNFIICPYSHFISSIISNLFFCKIISNNNKTNYNIHVNSKDNQYQRRYYNKVHVFIIVNTLIILCDRIKMNYYYLTCISKSILSGSIG
jgi:hypothetical protein